MGRINGYGQTKEVFIYNLVNEDKREGIFYSRLLDKINQIREALGTKSSML